MHLFTYKVYIKKILIKFSLITMYFNINFLHFLSFFPAAHNRLKRSSASATDKAQIAKPTGPPSKVS